MNNNILLILGASSEIGIGYIAEEHEKYNLIVAHYNNDNPALIELQQQIGDRLKLIHADFNDYDSINQFITHIMSNYRGVSHILHLVSPIVENIRFKKSNWDTFQKNYDIQVRSIYMILRELLPEMEKEKYGRIVMLLSSCTANEPPKFWSDYVTSKYALLGFMKALAREYADKKITINGISPSMMETKFLRNIPSMIVEQNAANSPLKRNAKVSDIIPIISMLLSDGSEYITGQNIVVSGGNI